MLTNKGIRVEANIRNAIRLDVYDIVVYAILVVAAFALFYPVISGYPVPLDYVDKVKWLDSWAMLF